MVSELFLALILVVLSSIAIARACNGFDEASEYLGRNMAPGVKGATINAVGSSLPELFMAIILLFFYHDQDGFSAGIATTAGSAVFNSVVIPMLCIMTVYYKGVSKGNGVFERVKEIKIDKNSVTRDAVFLLAAEIALIFFLGGTMMAWWMGGALVGIYLAYFYFLARGFGGEEYEQNDGDKTAGAPTKYMSPWQCLLHCDFNQLLFRGRPLTTKTAWVVLILEVLVVAMACYALAEAIIISANAIDVPPFFTAVILAAAASSVPDTILSMKDATKGNYDDAISNALGSNTFDITVALGLPLFIYGIMHGDILLSATDAGTAEVQVLRIILVVTTLVVLASFLLPKRLTIRTAYLFGGIYTGWLGYIIYSAGRSAGWW